MCRPGWPDGWVGELEQPSTGPPPEPADDDAA